MIWSRLWAVIFEKYLVGREVLLTDELDVNWGRKKENGGWCYETSYIRKYRCILIDVYISIDVYKYTYI